MSFSYVSFKMPLGKKHKQFLKVEEKTQRNEAWYFAQYKA